jgi:hypothetical protein
MLKAMHAQVKGVGEVDVGVRVKRVGAGRRMPTRRLLVWLPACTTSLHYVVGRQGGRTAVQFCLLAMTCLVGWWCASEASSQHRTRLSWPSGFGVRCLCKCRWSLLHDECLHLKEGCTNHHYRSGSTISRVECTAEVVRRRTVAVVPVPVVPGVAGAVELMAVTVMVMVMVMVIAPPSVNWLPT